MRKWLLLTYKIPREPTAGRVFVWRKLKQLAAIAIQDAIWVLPKTPRTEEQFQWLATEITELGGKAILWEADQLYATDAMGFEKQFNEPLILEYKSICAALKNRNYDLEKLSKRYEEAQKRDYFGLDLGKQTRDKLLAAGGGWVLPAQQQPK